MLQKSEPDSRNQPDEKSESGSQSHLPTPNWPDHQHNSLNYGNNTIFEKLVQQDKP
jgi:hypothetical protein